MPAPSPPSPPPPPPPLVAIDAEQFVEQTCASLFRPSKTNGIPPGADGVLSPQAAIDISVCQTCAALRRHVVLPPVSCTNGFQSVPQLQTCDDRSACLGTHYPTSRRVAARRLYNAVLQAADPIRKDHELAAGGTYQGLHAIIARESRCPLCPASVMTARDSICRIPTVELL